MGEEYIEEEKLEIFFGEHIMPKIQAVMASFTGENVEDVAKILKEQVFTSDMIELIRSEGLDPEKLSDIELNIYSKKLDTDELQDMSEEEMLEYIQKSTESDEKHHIKTIKDENIVIKVAELKPQIGIDDVSPVSPDDFNKMFHT